MSPITITGLGTSLDTESIIENLMKVERLPQTRLEERQGQAKARETALQGILTKLNEVGTALQALRSPTLWADTQTATSSSTAVSAELAGGAGPGGYQVEVTQLARGAQRTYAFSASEAASQLTVGGQTIELEPGATLADAVAAINSNHETGVSAVAVGGKLVLSSRATGAEAAVSAAGAGIAEETAKARAGQDTLYSIDGVAGSSSSNVIEGAIAGVTLTATALTNGPATISVSEPTPDTKSIASKVKAFVSAYNSAVELIETKVSEETVKEPKTQEEANKGVLFGDTALNSLLAGMRQTLSESGLGALGVSTGAPSASVTSNRWGSRCSPVRKSSALRISIALPAALASGSFMSVISAAVRTPAPLATLTIASASARERSSSGMKAPLPVLTSRISASRPAASFLLRIEAVISDTFSTVPVTSRME